VAIGLETAPEGIDIEPGGGADIGLASGSLGSPFMAPSGPLGPRSLVVTTHASHASGSSAEVKTIGFATQRMAVSRVIARRRLA
jgi:hypothetical protein